MVADPGPAVGDDGQHHHQLDQEGDPGDPVEDDGDVSRAPPGWDSVIATVGSVSAAAISIGVLRNSATRVLRASIPGA